MRGDFSLTGLPWRLIYAYMYIQKVRIYYTFRIADKIEERIISFGKGKV